MVTVLVVFQDCFPTGEGNLLGNLEAAGAVKAVVATLQHYSPFCIAAAASVLGRIGRTPGVGKTLIEASGAIPALVCVVQSLPTPGNLEKEKAVFRRYARDLYSLGVGVCVYGCVHVVHVWFFLCMHALVCVWGGGGGGGVRVCVCGCVGGCECVCVCGCVCV